MNVFLFNGFSLSSSVFRSEFDSLSWKQVDVPAHLSTHVDTICSGPPDAQTRRAAFVTTSRQV